MGIFRAILAATAVLLPFVSGFPFGAPFWVCNSMQPDETAHLSPGQDMATFDGNYTMSCTQDESSGPVTLKVTGVGGTQLKGILAQVRNGDGALKGSVTDGANTDDAPFKLDCGHKAATHKTASGKPSAKFSFTFSDGELSSDDEL